MRAGKLDKFIDVIRATSTVDSYGTPQESWTTYASMRAQMISANTEEFMRAFGSSSETATVFRIRYRDDLALSDIVVFQGRSFNLKEITELGRREGLDLRCTARDNSPWP